MIQIDNILKVVDIHKNQIHAETLGFLLKNFVTYEDKVMEEHLINIQDAADDVLQQDSEYLESNEFTRIIIDEVCELNNVCADNESGYVRFIE